MIIWKIIKNFLSFNNLNPKKVNYKQKMIIIIKLIKKKHLNKIMKVWTKYKINKNNLANN